MNSAADELQRQIKDVLETATATDQEMARSLKVIFGTTDNFDTESRKYGVDRDEADFSDSWTATKLGGVHAELLRQDWDNAAALLKHWMRGSGKPFEVDPQEMLREIPQFQQDVDKTLDEVRSHPDGTFSTSWHRSAPDPSDGEGSLNWYYGLNNFQYRIVGEKEDDEINYHVEVQKQYNWGTPSEHRRDLQGGPISFEQADIANLHSVGFARDFKVHGRSEEMTASD